MPFVHLETSLAKDKLPLNFMNVFCERLSAILDVELFNFNWFLEAGKDMAHKPGSEDVPYVFVRLEAFAFGNADDNARFAPEIFKALIELTGVAQDQIILIMKNVAPHEIGIDGGIFEPTKK